MPTNQYFTIMLMITAFSFPVNGQLYKHFKKISVSPALFLLVYTRFTKDYTSFC